ncbi:hypothetical protein N7512_000423 [Penicillium capsulatum]|nr:hypothetical protein N7512_000423 [Penicillium capsulatum]
MQEMQSRLSLRALCGPSPGDGVKGESIAMRIAWRGVQVKEKDSRIHAGREQFIPPGVSADGDNWRLEKLKASGELDRESRDGRLREWSLCTPATSAYYRSTIFRRLLTSATTHHVQAHVGPARGSPLVRRPHGACPPLKKARQRKRLRAVDRVVDTLSAALTRNGQSTKAVQRWYAEMPREEEMLPKDKYTLFDKKEKNYRKSLHKLPKWTRVSQRVNPPGF